MRMLTNEEREQLQYYADVAVGGTRIRKGYATPETIARERLAEAGRITMRQLDAKVREGTITDMGLKALRIAAILDQYV